MNWKCPVCGNEDNTVDTIRCLCGNEVSDNAKYFVTAKDYVTQQIPITKRRVAVSSIIISSACVLLLWSGTFGKLAGGFIGLALIIMTTKEEISRPLNSKDAIALGVFILLIIGMILWFPKHWDAELGKWLSSPIVVFPFWAIMLFVIYRRWKLSHKHNQALRP